MTASAWGYVGTGCAWIVTLWLCWQTVPNRRDDSMTIKTNLRRTR